MTSDFLKTWMDLSQPVTASPELVVLKERVSDRATVLAAICECLKDHLAGLEIIARIGSYERSLAFLRNKLPPSKQVRSGDFGEVLATEYVDQHTAYRVPIKKLRWKDDRSMAMRGNDVIAIRIEGSKWSILKGECKSRATLSTSTVKTAVEGLAKHAGRPNPSTMAFISARLREQERDKEAEVFEELQSNPPSRGQIEHMVFTLSGNSPETYLQEHIAAKGSSFRRHLVGCVIADHQDFIKSIFEALHAAKSE